VTKSKEFNVEIGKKITLRIETKDKFIEFNIPKRMMHNLCDLQYMLDECWHTIKLNKMDKDLKDFFKITEQCIDSLDEGECYAIGEDRKVVISKDKYYLSGKKPEWTKK
jgi:hypothetical protein